MVTDEMIKRINFLSKKSKTEGLSPEEKAEQASLRAEYVKAFKASLVSTLDSAVVERSDGTREKLARKVKDGEIKNA